MQSNVLVALLTAFIHAFSSVYSKRLYVLADHPAQVAFYSLFRAPGAITVGHCAV